MNILSDGLNSTDRGSVSNLVVEGKSDPSVDPAFISFLELLHVRLSPISDVISLADVDNITSSDWGLSVDPLMETVPKTDEGLSELAATVFKNEMFVNGLVSRDSTGTVILVELSFHYDDYLDEAHRVFERLQELAEPHQGPEKIQIAGVPMVNVYSSNYMSGDLVKLTPIVILVVMVVMYVSFRMLRAVFIPLSVVFVALVWTLGVMGLVGRPITFVVSAMPVMLIAIGIADGIHLITEYRLLWAKFNDRDRAILATMRQLALPVIFTSLTTMAGFASLATSNLRSIQDFGVFTSVGVFSAMIFSLTFVPAALKLMKPPKPHFGSEVGEGNRLGLALQRLGNFVVRRRRWVFVGTVLFGAVSATTFFQLKVGSTMVGMFHEDSEIYQASQMLNAKFGGTEVMNIVVDTRTNDGLKDPEVLGKIAALQDTLESLDIVGYTTSLADHVKRINLVMNNNNPDFNRVPDETETVTETERHQRGGKEHEIKREVQVRGRDLIAQYVLLYENAGATNLDKLADYDYRKANIVVMIRTSDTPKMRRVKEKAEGFLMANFGSDVDVNYAGCSSLCIVADDLIIPGQLRSLGIAMVVVFGLLSLVLRSTKYGFIALLPLLVTLLLVFALMSIFGLYLDAASALVASIVLGIGVDYSVHFLSRYLLLRKKGMGLHDAIGETQRTTGQAIVFNSLAVTIGFLVLLLSSFWPVNHIGWLVAANMILSAALAIVLVPAVLVAKAPAPKRASVAIDAWLTPEAAGVAVTKKSQEGEV